MLKQASIEIRFSHFYQQYIITRLIQMLLDGGWVFNSQGSASYLTIEHSGIAQWISVMNVSSNELMEIFQEKDYRREPIGIVLTWQKTNIGGTFLFQSNEKLFIALTLNRKTMQGLDNVEITDFNWYLTRLLYIFYENDIEVENFSFTEVSNF